MTMPRSAFVTVLAWLSLAMAVVGVIGGVLQWITLLQMQSDGSLQQVLDLFGTQLPPALRWCFEHMGLLTLVSVVGSLLIGVAAWGLLQRREWGRIGFIALLVLSCTLPIASALLFDNVMRWTDAQIGLEVAQAEPMFGAMRSGMRLLNYGLSFVLICIHLGIALKLCTRSIRDEFH